MKNTIAISLIISLFSLTLLWRLGSIGNPLGVKHNFKSQISLIQSQIDSSWGIGIISHRERNMAESLNMAELPISAYDSPQGRQIGIIIRDPTSISYPHFGFYLRLNDDEQVGIARSDYREIKYEGSCLKYYEAKQKFVKVLLHSYKNGVWVNEADLGDFYAQNWSTFLLKKKETFFRLQDTPLKIYKTPAVNSPIVTSVQGTKYYIRLTENVNGNWAQVVIEEFDQPYCSSNEQNLIKNWKGWISLLSDRGNPRIWFFTRGC